MTKPPNILFFFTDDQRFDTIGALGNLRIVTPNIDRLVQAGTSFKQAYIMGGSSGAVCMPSRAMVMTGRSLYRIHGCGEEIAEEHALLGETLLTAGYNCFGTGKWHNSPRAYARSFNDGAEIFFGGMDDHWNVMANDYDPAGAYEQRAHQTHDYLLGQTVVTKICDHISPGKHSSELFGDAAVDYLEEYDSEDPFFMYLSFMAPHDPRTMPKEYLEMYDPDSITLPPNCLPEHPFDNGALDIRDEYLADTPRDPHEIRKELGAYYAMITHLDAQIGRVLDVLDQKGLTDNTIIVFAGDNGLALGQHGLMGKQNVYEHSVHVPLIFSGPGIPQNETSESFAYLIDVFPTLCDLTGTDTPSTVEGRSLVPALEDPQTKIRTHVHCAYTHLMRSVRDERYKLIEYNVDGIRTTQLFDLQTDPWEMNNLADNPAYESRRAGLWEELLHWRDVYGDAREQGQRFWSFLDS
jgi:arylsulfatase A-like enzyme